MRPSLSVGIPVYNGEAFIEETLRTLSVQTFSDFELIISDNASTDRTEEICRDLAMRDRRIRYFRNDENLGLARNYNRLPHLASGRYYKWAMADDPYEPTFLERCVGVLDADPGVVLAFTRAQFIDEQGRPLDIEAPSFDLQFDAPFDRLRSVLEYRSWVNSILGVLRRDRLLETDLLPHYPGGDYVLLGQLALMGRLFEVPEKLLRRRIHGAASSQVAADQEKVAEMISGKRGRAPHPEWSRLRDEIRTIGSSGLHFREKLRLFAVLVRRLRLQRMQFLAELRRIRLMVLLSRISADTRS